MQVIQQTNVFTVVLLNCYLSFVYCSGEREEMLS